ncbi:MAG TPA: delta-aminolevulinic acid dehydratase [Bacteroidia bacterium]|jgi:hypothetical protein|nr:delta-aminolevulinic acid dehydratase [Bacteroidia bacterium]
MNIAKNEYALIENSLEKLRKYIEKEEFKGYDPYDTLNSFFKFKYFGKFVSVLAIQFQKRNPVNIRPVLGIKKNYNPKAIGLFLYSYCILQKNNPNKDYSKQIDFLFAYLKDNPSKGFSGYCWGYNFDWASSGKYIKAYSPNVVVTSFISKGIFAYYNLTKDAKAFEILKSIGNFILKDLPLTETKEGVCFSYTTLGVDCCYNASLLAAQTLSQIYSITKELALLEKIKPAIDFVLSKQFDDGHWNYSIEIETGIERKQIDFHQGYIIDCIKDILKSTGISDNKYTIAIEKGTDYYYKEQFFENGQSKWRLPKIYPVEIHNQSQGIITFCDSEKYKNFATIIAKWTIDNMQDKQGYFYYRKLKNYTHKIPYMRWSQAWMFIALTELVVSLNNKKN